MMDTKPTRQLYAYHRPLRQIRRSVIENWLLRAFALVGVLSILKSLLSRLDPNWISTSTAIDDIYPDTDYPLRPATEPWNISTSYPYPRQFNKVVTEGTWLRIATHPVYEEIVFDMLGDLYCMPTTGEANAEARPFLQGIPYDKEAEFSANGSLLVFTSDAGFGIDNIWTLPYTNCQDMSHKSSQYTRGTAIQQTNSTFRFFTSPAFHSTLPKLVATKWYLTGRPNGAGEIWEFPLQTAQAKSVPERSGQRVVARKLPATWPRERYFESQLGAEQARYTGDGIIYTRNVRDDDSGKFSYNKDVHIGVNAIFMLNTTTGTTDIVVDATPGGANMPRLSHDGRTLAFVRRVQEKGVLVLKDLQSGTLHHIWTELTYDVSLIPAFMGAYPNYGFSANDGSIIIWSSGQIYKVPLKLNHLGERIAAESPRVLPFRATIDLALGKTRYSETDIKATELQDEGRIEALRGLRGDSTGERVVFEAAGDTYHLNIKTGLQTRIPKVNTSAQYYSPSFVDSTPLVLHARWSDQNLTVLELVDLESGAQISIDGIPRGRYISPVMYGDKIAYVRTGKDYILGDVEETAAAGVWLGDVHLSSLASIESPAIVKNLRLIETSPSGQDTKLNFKMSRGRQYLIIQSERSICQVDVQDLSRSTVVTGKTSVEMQLSNALPKGLSLWERLRSSSSPAIAFRDFQHAWIAPFQVGEYNIWSKPGDKSSPKGLVRLSQNGGHDVVFSGDGSQVFWLFGSRLFHASLASVLDQCSRASIDARDSGACVSTIARSYEIVANYETDLGQLKRESNGRALALINATICSMDDAKPLLLRNGTIILDGGEITSVGFEGEIAIPANADVVDVGGGLILPGFVDVHGHWGGFLSQYPSVSWELETFLGYGVTTIHNPSSKNVGGYVERALVEKGAFYGPRIYHTGDVLYGSTQTNVYTEINSLEDARSALRRIKAEGGNSSFSVKNYQLPSRSARQRLLLEAEKLDMLIFPEGGWSLDWDMTYFIDGMTTLEHPVPIPELYDDVLSLIAASGSSYTQVAVMNYGGLFGQGWVHQRNNIPNDPKLRKYVKHDILEALTEVKQAPNSSYQFFDSTRSAAKLAARGVRTNIGAHGEQPIGFLFHSEMLIHGLGGQSPYDVFKAATIGGATSLGLQSAIGSIEKGKLADLVIYPPGVDTVEGAWVASMDIKFVVRGGRIFEVEDGLVEYWPRRGRRLQRGRINPEDE